MRVAAEEGCETEDVCHAATPRSSSLVTRASLAAARPRLASSRSWPG